MMNEVLSQNSNHIKIQTVASPGYKRQKHRYISQYVMETLGKLKKLDAFEVNNEVKSILDRNVRFVNEEVIKDYKKLLELAAEKKIDLEKII